MNNNHPNRSKWLEGNGGTEFLQFANARITREPFPLGGFMYTTTNSGGSAKVLYSGNSYEKAREALSKAIS